MSYDEYERHIRHAAMPRSGSRAATNTIMTHFSFMPDDALAIDAGWRQPRDLSEASRADGAIHDFPRARALMPILRAMIFGMIAGHARRAIQAYTGITMLRAEVSGVSLLEFKEIKRFRAASRFLASSSSRGSSSIEASRQRMRA